MSHLFFFVMCEIRSQTGFFLWMLNQFSPLTYSLFPNRWPSSLSWRLHIHLVYFQEGSLPASHPKIKEPQWKKLYWWTSSEASTREDDLLHRSSGHHLAHHPWGFPSHLPATTLRLSTGLCTRESPPTQICSLPPLTPPYNSRNSLPDPQPLWENHAFLFHQEIACFEEMKVDLPFL